MLIEDRTSLEFPSRGLTSVPLCRPGGLVCCDASGPGGYPLRVMLDTGTDPSAIDARLARRLALHTGGSGLGVGAVSAEVPFTEAVLPWLRIGDLTIRDLFAPAVDLRGSPFDVDVVLGYNVLRQLALRIDYRRELLTLAHPDLGIPTLQPGVALPLAFFEHFPALRDVAIGGHTVALATLDTGSNAALTVGPDLGAALGLQAHAGAPLGSGAGFGMVPLSPLRRRSHGCPNLARRKADRVSRRAADGEPRPAFPRKCLDLLPLAPARQGDAARSRLFGVR